MHVDQLATSAAHDAIVPLDDLARDLELRQDDFAAPVWQAVRTGAGVTGSRWTCIRSACS
jgi:hypothetical protein